MTLGQVLELARLDWYLILSTRSLYWLHDLSCERALDRRLELSLLHRDLLRTKIGWHNWILKLALVLSLLEWHLIWATSSSPRGHDGISVFT